MTEQMEKLQSVLYPVALKKAAKGMQNIVREDTGKVISTVSERYELVQNRDVFLPFIKHFGEQSLISCVPRKKACVVEIETGRTFELGKTGKASDIVKERLVIQNSYDRTRSYQFLFGALRCVCLNGLYAGVMTLQFKKIHTGNIPAEEMVKTVLKGYKDNNFDTWRKMAKMSLTLKERIQSINKLECLEIAEDDRDANSTYRNFAINERLKAKTLEYLSKPESTDNCASIWGVFNAVNRAISTELRGSYLFHKRVLANRLAEQYFVEKFKLN